MTYRHDNVVVCGVDGSDASFNALVWAAEEAVRRNALLDIVCCYQEPTYDGHRGDISLNEEQARKVMMEARAKIAHIQVDIQESLETDDPTEVLLERSKKVARVVIGSKGKTGGLADRLIGSVISALTARAYCAVVVVPSESMPDVIPVEHIVCGVDGSDSSQVALELAVREAARWKAKLSCVSSINLNGVMWVPGPGYHQEMLDDVKAGLQENVAKAAQGYDIDVHCHVIEGNPAALLAEFSTAVDMLVIGTRGRGGFVGLLLGSTSQNVIAHAACPTIVVPQRTEANEDAPWSNVPWTRNKKEK